LKADRDLRAGGLAKDGPVDSEHVDEWLEIRIRAEPIRPRRRESSFDVTFRAGPEAWAALREMLKPGSGFLRTYRDIRVERRTVRAYRVESPWELIPEGGLPEA
jgi:hypothetical protein